MILRRCQSTVPVCSALGGSAAHHAAQIGGLRRQDLRAHLRVYHLHGPFTRCRLHCTGPQSQTLRLLLHLPRGWGLLKRKNLFISFETLNAIHSSSTSSSSSSSYSGLLRQCCSLVLVSCLFHCSVEMSNYRMVPCSFFFFFLDNELMNELLWKIRRLNDKSSLLSFPRKTNKQTKNDNEIKSNWLWYLINKPVEFLAPKKKKHWAIHNFSIQRVWSATTNIDLRRASRSVIDKLLFK